MNMSMSDTHNAGISTAFLSETAKLKMLWQRYMQYRLYRKTLAEMQRMSTRELADFGLERCELSRIAHRCVYGCKT
jgi:uncharacterized protein YjiS (DUF1127 family)